MHHQAFEDGSFRQMAGAFEPRVGFKEPIKKPAQAAAPQVTEAINTAIRTRMSELLS